MFPLSNMMKAFIKKGSLTIIDHKDAPHKFIGEPGGPEVTMKLSDPSLYRKLVLNPELHAGEAYMDGRLSFVEGSTLREFLTLFSINRGNVTSYPIQKVVRAISMKFRKLQQANPVGKAQANVAHHYDIGNEFYKLFLDKNMLYSCAYFMNDNESLEQAQRNKLRLLTAKLNLQPGQKVLDIGCGWGDLALYIAKMADVEVLGVTLSKEQQALASKRAEDEGLADRVRFKLMDYREVNEQFDRIVSVGMFEHVGVHHYDEFFKKLNTLMPDNGLALIHSIGHMSPPGMASSWLRKYIFPGAYSPSMSEVLSVVEQNHLWVTDLEILRTHYATTLAHWEKRFQENRAEVEEMFDEKFARMWEFYLISAEMMFRTGAQMVFHIQLSRNRDAAPLVRDYTVDVQRQYEEREAELKLTL